MSRDQNTQGSGGAGTGSGSGSTSGAGTGTGNGGAGTGSGRRRLTAALLVVVVVVGLAALVGGAGNDHYLDPARAAVLPLALLAAYTVGSLVVGPGRPRTKSGAST